MADQAPSQDDAKNDAVAQYELPDSSFDAELDLPIEDQAKPKEETKEPAVEPAPSKDDVRPRNPDGTFAKPAHSARRLKLAAELGIEGAADLSAEELDDEIVLQTRLLTARSKSEPAEKHVPPEPDELDIELSEDEFDPKLVKMFNALKATAKAQRAEIARLQAGDQERQILTHRERCDKAFAEFEDFLGKGSGEGMDKSSVEYKRRVAILREVDNDASSASLEAKIKKAAALFNLTPKAAEDVTAKDKKEAWSKANLARPTSREGAQEPKGVQRAQKAVAKQLREKGLADEDLGPEESGLPD